MYCSRFRHLLLIVILCLGSFAYAAYLSNMPVTVTQPDGSTLDCLASGDEYHNWLHDKDNFTIIRDPKTGFYCYAEFMGDEVVAGSAIAGKDSPQSRGIPTGVNISERAYKQMRKNKFPMPDETRDAPTTGTINNIVIYIRFSDETEFGENISTYDGWFNSNTSSQKNYFLEASYNQLTVNTHFYPSPSNNLVVSWQASQPRSYYQPYDATSNPNGYTSDDQRRTREFSLLQSATNGVSAQIPTNLTIDSDNDGNVDNVVFIVRGSAGAWSSLLWPHRWVLWDRNVYINGKRVYDFNLQLQTFLAGSNVGVICHEFFHTLGAPDLYHYESNGIAPAGSWDLMESNQNPPQHMTAYMKWKYGGWITSIPTISADQQYTLNPLSSPTGNAYRINSNNGNQYYVVEYRKKTGTFESSIPGSGMLVYRIDTSVGDGNADGPPDELYIYRPGGTSTANGSISTAHFSAEVGRNKINNTTNPAPFLQDGGAGNLSLYNIGSSAGSTITFNKGTAPIVTIDFSTNPYSEGFDTFSYIPDGWENQISSGSYSFERVTSGSSPTCSPQAGAGMLRYNSYSASNGSSAMLATPRLSCGSASEYSYDFSFWMYRDTGYSTCAEKVEVYLSSTVNLSGSPTLLGTVHRYTEMAPAVGSAGWYQYTYSLPISVAGYYYVVLKATSAYGNNMFMDSLVLTRTLMLPSPASNPSPADAATEIGFSQQLSWSAASGNPSSYKLYLGTNNPPSNLLNGTNIGNVLSYTHNAGLPLGRTIYWKVVPTNSGGDASGCPIWSFTTVADYSSFPVSENFGSTGAAFPPTNWTRYSGVLANPSTLTSSSLWGSDDWANVLTSPPNYSARINIYGSSRYGWLVTPLLHLPVNSMLQFDLALTDYANSNPISSDPSGLTGTDDQFMVLIGNGTSWSPANIIRQWDNAGSAYVYNEITTSGQKVLIDLSAHAGYKYIAFYGASSVSNADNDLFIDNIAISTRPSAATLIASPNEWHSGNVELGSNNAREFTFYNSGSGTMIITSISLSGSSAYTLGNLPAFPKMVSFGQSFSFTAYFNPLATGSNDAYINVTGNTPAYIALSGTSIDPRIAALPYLESFDAFNPPALPLGWRAYVSSSSTSAQASGSASYYYSAPNSAYMYNSSDASADIRLISPQVLLPLNTLKLKFFARGGSTGMPLLIGTVPNADGSGQFDNITTINLSDSFSEYAVPLDTYYGSNTYLAFKHGLGGTTRSIYIDNVCLEQILTSDLAISSFSGLGIGAVGSSVPYLVSVTNNGTQIQSSYSIRLLSADRRLELASMYVNTPLAPNETAQHTLNWTPNYSDTYSVYAAIELMGDGNSANDVSATASANIYPADNVLPVSGDPFTTTKANSLPLNFYWKNSLSECLYTAQDMQLDSGNISAIVYKSNFVQELLNKPVKVWIKNTDATDLNSGWSSFADYSLVFDGTLNFPLGVNLITIPFNAPFAYTGGNIALLVNRTMDTEYFNSNNHFYYSDTPEYPARSRYIQSDSESFNPAAPSQSGTLGSMIPLTVFIMQRTYLDTPQLSISQEGNNLRLSWNAVAGAANYRIYASPTPDFGRSTPIATTPNLYYQIPAGSKMFYRIVATSNADRR